MTPEILRDQLSASANLRGWTVEAVAEFTLPHFRGRAEDIRELPIEDTFGLRLGAFPVLIAPVRLGSADDMLASLRPLHSQMVISRSYMRPEEVINAHIMLCATATDPLQDWRQAVDLAERDERVCRKIVWIPDHDALEKSYENFRMRTFLATPWLAAGTVMNAPLDHNQDLAQRILVRSGLSRPAADRWVELAEQLKDEPDTMIAEFDNAKGLS